MKIVDGLRSWDGKLFLAGIGDIASPVAGTIILGGGNLIGWFQSLVGLQGKKRALTGVEKDRVERVFRTSLDCEAVRIIEGRAGIFSLNDRPFTLGTTIYMKSTSDAAVLVHEVTHAWQFRHVGNRYVSDALYAQFFIADRYNWQKEINERGKDDWAAFNKESQAQLLQDLWDKGQLRDAAGTLLDSANGVFYDANGTDRVGCFEVAGRDYTVIANGAVRTVREA